MSSSPTPSILYDDYISTEELFQSFMDVALIAEQELKTNHASTNSSSIIPTNKTEEVDKKAIFSQNEKNSSLNNNAAVLMPLPLLLRKTSEPIYECVPDQQSPHQQKPQSLPQEQQQPQPVQKLTNGTNHHTAVSRKVSDTNSENGTIVTVSASPTKKISNVSLPTPDYPGANGFTDEQQNSDGVATTTRNNSESAYDTVASIQQQVPEDVKIVTDVYAVVNKNIIKSKQQGSNIDNTQVLQEHSLEDLHIKEVNNSTETFVVNSSAIIDNNVKENPYNTNRISDTYETIVSLTPTTPPPVTDGDGIETKVLVTPGTQYSDYAIIESLPTQQYHQQPEPPTRSSIANRNKENQNQNHSAGNVVETSSFSSSSTASDYETVQDLKLDLTNQGLLTEVRTPFFLLDCLILLLVVL